MLVQPVELSDDGALAPVMMTCVGSSCSLLCLETPHAAATHLARQALGPVGQLRDDCVQAHRGVVQVLRIRVQVPEDLVLRDARLHSVCVAIDVEKLHCTCSASELATTLHCMWACLWQHLLLLEHGAMTYP